MYILLGNIETNGVLYSKFNLCDAALFFGFLVAAVCLWLVQHGYRERRDAFIMLACRLDNLLDFDAEIQNINKAEENGESDNKANKKKDTRLHGNADFWKAVRISGKAGKVLERVNFKAYGKKTAILENLIRNVHYENYLNTLMRTSLVWDFINIFLLGMSLLMTIMVIYISAILGGDKLRVLIYSSFSIFFTFLIYVIKPREKAKKYRKAHFEAIRIFVGCMDDAYCAMQTNANVRSNENGNFNNELEAITKNEDGINRRVNAMKFKDMVEKAEAIIMESD